MRKVLAYCSFFSLFALCLLFLGRTRATAQNSSQTSAPPAPAKPETIAKPLTENERKKQEAKLNKELETPYKRWLNEEVYCIITPDERKAFGVLNTDDERESFIENFW